MTLRADLKTALAENDFFRVWALSTGAVIRPPAEEAEAKAVVKALRAVEGWPAAAVVAEYYAALRPGWRGVANNAVAMTARLGCGHGDLLKRAAVFGIAGKDLREKEALRHAFANDHAAAIQTREALLAEAPDDFANLMDLLWLHWFQGDPARAAALLTQAEAHPDAEGMRRARLNQARRWLGYGVAVKGGETLADLAALTLANSHDTALATRMIAAARRSGALTDAQSGEAPPSILHQYWEGAPLPDGARALTDLSLAAMPGWSHQLWNEQSGADLLRETLGADGAQAFAAASYPAFRANLVRLAALWRDGGAYLDIDDRALAAPSVAFPGGVGVYVEALGPTANNLLVAPARAPFILGALKQAAETVLDGRFGDDGWSAAGVGLVTRAVAQEAAKASQEGRVAAISALSESQARARHVFHIALDYKRAGGWKARRYGAAG